MTKLRVLDLFSGIGGFSLGLERTGGFETVAFCEIEPYPRAVLAKHWPHVPCYEDVRTLTADTLAKDGIAVDVICGGFPCQDLSFAGKRSGLEGARSGLWREYARLIAELRPRWVVIENVPGLLSGADTIELPPDQCVCGWSARWGGLHHHLPSQRAGALRADRCGHVSEGASGTPATASGVRRVDLQDPRAVGEMGGGARLAHIRAPTRGILGGCYSVPDHEEATGGIGIVPATDDRWTAEEAEWLGFVDGSSGEGCEDHSGARDGSEQEGAGGSARNRMVCASCGRDMGNAADRSYNSSWFGRVQRDLASLGYDATWDCIPASAVGAPHRRDRVWIVAYARGQQHEGDSVAQRREEPAQLSSPYTNGKSKHACSVDAEMGGASQSIGDANGSGLAIRKGQPQDIGEELSPSIGTDWWLVEPDVGRVAHGVSNRVDRLGGLGNAVVHQVVEAIGRAIMSAEASQ